MGVALDAVRHFRHLQYKKQTETLTFCIFSGAQIAEKKGARFSHRAQSAAFAKVITPQILAHRTYVRSWMLSCAILNTMLIGKACLTSRRSRGQQGLPHLFPPLARCSAARQSLLRRSGRRRAAESEGNFERSARRMHELWSPTAVQQNFHLTATSDGTIRPAHV